MRRACTGVGGGDLAAFADLDPDDLAALIVRINQQPSLHSSRFVPVIEPTLSVGVRAPVVAARTWLLTSPDA
jgi:hypothetical protein